MIEHQTPTASKLSTATLPQHIAKRLEEIWQQAYSARTKEDLLQLYANWAESYDEDHEAIGFFGHISTCEMLAKYVKNPSQAKILDAGAGTGAAGTALSQRDFENIVGIDLSEAMLAQAEKKGVYQELHQADLGYPLDMFQVDSFDAAVLVGVFSYGQAPAHALEEVLRVVKPGGVIVFTMRTDFFEEDAMGVRSKMNNLEEAGFWTEEEVTEPAQYLPGKDPDAQFRVWCYRAAEGKTPAKDPTLIQAAQQVLTSDEPVKRLDHRHIWNSSASRLYNRYIETPEYYLNDCEEEILSTNADEVVGEQQVIVELGCGSAKKVKHLLNAAVDSEQDSELLYCPIDLSPEALESTEAEIEETFNDQINVKPIRAPFDEAISKLGEYKNKLVLFFGSSIGNLESLEETVDFLQMIGDHLHPGDRFVVGMDLHKDEKILRQAYQAGEPNRLFFLNMIRRINDELGGNFDLDAFYQDSSYDRETPYKGIENRCVNFKLVTEKPQRTTLKEIGLPIELNKGEAIQVGTSRKFEKEDIAKLGAEAQLTLHRQWTDQRGYFSLNEMKRADS